LGSAIVPPHQALPTHHSAPHVHHQQAAWIDNPNGPIRCWLQSHQVRMFGYSTWFKTEPIVQTCSDMLKQMRLIVVYIWFVHARKLHIMCIVNMENYTRYI
jgi:hypothetical protein